MRSALAAGWTCLCFFGCRPLVPDEVGPLSADEAAHVEHALDVWVESGRELPARCSETWKFRTNRDGGEVFERWCGAPAALEGGEEMTGPQVAAALGAILDGGDRDV